MSRSPDITTVDSRIRVIYASVIGVELCIEDMEKHIKVLKRQAKKLYAEIDGLREKVSEVEAPPSLRHDAVRTMKRDESFDDFVEYHRPMIEEALLEDFGNDRIAIALNEMGLLSFKGRAWNKQSVKVLRQKLELE